jgi:predicted permease
VVGGRGTHLRNLLVVGEIAVSFTLAIGAGLLLRSFIGLTKVELGYRPQSVLVMQAHRPATGLQEYVRVARFFSRIGAELGAVPGVTAVAAAMGLPTGQYGSNGSFVVEGQDASHGWQGAPHAGFRLASPGYFAALGVPLVSGRDFNEADAYDAPFVAIVSRALARRTFPGEDPIGKRVRCGLDAPDTWMTIVGIVGDMRQDSPEAEPASDLYMPLAQHPYHANEVEIVVRTSVPPGSVAPALRQAMSRVAPTTAVRFSTLDDMVLASIGTQRFRTWLITLFAGLALVLAMAGVYGVMAYVTAQRTAEFGVRMALGAGRLAVFGLVIGRATRLAGAGLALGLALSLAEGRLVRQMLFGLRPFDAATYAAVVAVLGVVVFAAAAVPAWQASRVDPLSALRQE